MVFVPVASKFFLHSTAEQQAFRDIEPLEFFFDEKVGELYRAEIVLRGDDWPLSGSALHHRATLQFGRQGCSRQVHGIILRQENIYDDEEQNRVRVFLGPALALLDQSISSRFWHASSVELLIRQVLEHDVVAIWGGLHCTWQSGAPIDASPIKVHLTDSLKYLKLPTLLQFQESLLNFLHRVLRDFGLFYVFVHDGPKVERIVISDCKDAFERNAHAPLVLYRAPTVAHSLSESLGELTVGTQASTAALVGLNDLFHPSASFSVGARAFAYQSLAQAAVSALQVGRRRAVDGLVPVALNHFQPASTMAAEAASYVNQHQLYALFGSDLDFDGMSPPKSSADTMAPVELSSDTHSGSEHGHTPTRAFATVVASARQRHLDCEARGQSWSRDNRPEVQAGIDVQICDAKNKVDEKFFITEATHHWRLGPDGSYENSFRVLPQAVSFANAPFPNPDPGLQPGFITGPIASDVFLDAHGRVLVQLPWATPATKTPSETQIWTKVATPWAGPGFGAVFQPRIGMQVLVAFVRSDTAGPVSAVIVGSTHNQDNPSPFGRGTQRTVSGWRTESFPLSSATRYNELSFDDAYQDEKLHIRAQRRQTNWVGVSQKTSIGEDRSFDLLSHAAGMALWYASHADSEQGRSIGKVGRSLFESVQLWRKGKKDASSVRSILHKAADTVANNLSSKASLNQESVNNFLQIYRLSSSLLATPLDPYTDETRVFGDKYEWVQQRKEELIHHSRRRFVGAEVASIGPAGGLGQRFEEHRAHAQYQARQIRLEGRPNAASSAPAGAPNKGILSGLGSVKKIATSMVHQGAQNLKSHYYKSAELPEPEFREDVVIAGARRHEVTADEQRHIGGSDRHFVKKDKIQDIAGDMLQSAGKRFIATAKHLIQLASEHNLHVKAHEKLKIKGKRVLLGGHQSIRLDAQHIVMNAGKSLTFQQGKTRIILKDGQLEVKAGTVAFKKIKNFYVSSRCSKLD